MQCFVLLTKNCHHLHNSLRIQAAFLFDLGIIRLNLPTYLNQAEKIYECSTSSDHC